MTEEKKGVIYATLTYMMWGILPIYWKLLDHVGSGEILTGRVFWSFWFTLLLVLLLGMGKKFASDLKGLLKSKKDFFSLLAASYLISLNWFLFIWAVTNDHLVETSLGYYINPLVSVLLGVFFLKERLMPAQRVAFVLAAIGVTILTVSYGQFPWLAFLLAFSFGFYGLIKKTIRLNALRGLALETMFVLPVAIGYYVFLFATGRAEFLNVGLETDVLIMLSGAATALPLVLFAMGAQRIPLYLIGFLQYIAPTSMLILGVFVYGESFGSTDLLSFTLIWTALVLFTLSKVMNMKVVKKEQA
ncbi:EamA family transporter RarD [Planococcus lenghuensis]|uniref:EamA family transporter n=1 Tax=Planococcus lenghuensis TaxID=2213202 RepID=A0A1Q2KX92_9BACL|nr:EamA family transporter RarD [Planococcus lenghuensis]AQQ52799.1 EamA family transporter [Planococcus lenghuensis]